MRTKTMLISIVTGAVLAAAAPAHAVTVQQATFKNTQIAFFAFLQTNVTCADQTAGTASAFVFVSGGSFVNPFGTGTGTAVDVFGFSDSCTGQSFNEADGFIQGGVTGPNPNLTSAVLTGSVDAPIDFGPGGTVAIAVDLTFSGDGQLSSGRNATEVKTATTPAGPFTITIQRGAFRIRTADVSGTITIGGVAFPVDIDMGASLFSNDSTTITVSKP